MRVRVRVGVRVSSVNLSGVLAKAASAQKRALTMTTEKAIADTRPYVPYREGDLAGSTGRSPVSTGRIIYDQPYARAQYYGLPGKSRLRHLKAIMFWFEASKAVNTRKWRDVYAREYARALSSGGGSLGGGRTWYSPSRYSSSNPFGFRDASDLDYSELDRFFTGALRDGWRLVREILDGPL